MPLRTLLQLPQQQQQQQQPSSPDDISPSIMITVLVLAIAVILSASLYLLLRFLRRPSSAPSLPSFHPSSHHLSRVTPTNKNPLIDTLPLFPFHSLSSSSPSHSSDCAICLSKFQPKDTLRLLPVCCHAFHQYCIDTWLNNNFSCPLCRSPVLFLDDTVSTTTDGSHSLSSSSRSFRIQLGNVSRRQPSDNSSEIRRSYSISDSFDYIVHDPHDIFRDMPLDATEFKHDPTLDDVLAAEVGPRGGGGWLKEYLSHSFSSASSRTASFRGSARWFFTGSGRRNNVNTTSLGGGNGDVAADLEGRHFGEEIGELFRWLSGV